MAYRLYIVPRTGTGTFEDTYRPKYIADLKGGPWVGMPFGLEPHILVSTDLSGEDHATIAAYSDVIVIPANLDNTIGTNRDAVVNALGTLNIPAGWVTSAMTYREVIKPVAAIFQFAQRLKGHGNIRIFDTGITLSTKFNQLPAAVRTKLKGAAESMNFDTSSLSGTSTIRQILKEMADQWGDKEIKLGGITL